jgi:choline-sulfatase
MSQKSNPNLLYIHTDQHTPFVLGCYGDAIVQTPHLDQLTASGIVFEQVYCNSPICVPSRMSMLTGRHPYQNQVWTNEHILDSSIPTFAHALGAAGYRPLLFGRMHALGPDQLHGYAERYVGDHSLNHLGGSSVDRGILEGTAGPQRISLEKSGAGQSAYQVHDEYVTAATIDYLNQYRIQRQAGIESDPFCLTVGYMLPHPPYVARQEDFDRYQDSIRLPAIDEPFSESLHPHIRWWRQHTGIASVSEAEIRRARAAYWGLVTRVDTLIGHILDTLRANDLLENTLIIYTSDHGDMLGEHGLWWKHVFYEHSVRVPLIISWPGHITGGQRGANVVSASDVNATILDALDAPPLPESPGRSLLPLMTGQATDWDDVAFSEYCTDQFCGDKTCFQRMIRRDQWKLIYYHGQAPQLFDLVNDPQELHDLAQDPAYQTIRQQLTAEILRDWHPDAIAQIMARKRAERDILRAWANHTHPEERYRWDLKPEMNYLD